MLKRQTHLEFESKTLIFQRWRQVFSTGHHDQAVRYLYIGAMMDVDAGNELIAKFKESLAQHLSVLCCDF